MEKKNSDSNLRPINDKNDVIEIPIGKYVRAVRQNPWIAAAFVLAIVLVVFLISGFSGGIGANKAGKNAVDFINAQGQGNAFLVSAEKEGKLYKVVINYNQEEIPVYVTLDGEFLVPSVIPLGNELREISPSNPSMGTSAQNDADDDAVLGSPDAPVTIIEFSDQQCPYCKTFWSSTFPQLKSEYIDTGKVKFVYRDYPLNTDCNSGSIQTIHPEACKAAEAAECIREKGGDGVYWKMHDKLFENQGTLSTDNYKMWAKEIGYDIGSCLDSGKYAQEVAQDAIDGGDLGTPTFFVNGIKLEGALPFANFKQIIDSQLSS